MLIYEKYLKMGDSISFEEALKIYYNLMESADVEDEDFICLWNEVIDKANEYVKIRNKWTLMSRAEKIEKDSSRTSKHNTYMGSLDILARYMKSRDMDTSWYGDLGNCENTSRRKLGDFAAYILLFGALSNR